MANNKQPIARRCRALDITPATMGYANKKSNRNPGGTRRKKVSEYGAQLKEKQKVRFIYGVLEKQFHHYFEKQRVNKINNRKEFFRVDLEEIKKVVLENHNATVNFVDIPDAVEYRETLKLEGKTRPVEVHYSESKGIQEEPTEEPGVKPVSAVASSTTSTLFEEPAQRPVKAKPVKIKPKKIGVVRPQA